MFDNSSQLFGAEIKKPRSISDTLSRFWQYFRTHKLALLVVVLLVLVSTGLQTAVPVLTGQAVDCYLVPDAVDSAESCFLTAEIPTTTAGRLAGLAVLSLAIAASYLLSALVSGLQFYNFAKTGYTVLHELRTDIFRHIHRLSLGYFSRNSAGDTMSRLTNDIDTIVQMIGFPLLSTVQSIFAVTFIIVAMLVTNVPYALLSLAILPVMVISVQWFSRQARKAFRVARQSIGDVNTDLQENIAAVREVQAFSREEENIEQFRSQNAANRDANVRAQVYSTALGPIVEALGYVNIAIIVALGGYALLNGGSLLGATVSAGTIVAFIQFSQSYQRPVQQIAVLWANIQSAIAGGERIFDFMDEVPDLEDKADARSMPEIAGRVTLENVWAEYLPGEPILKGVDISAEKGQTIAIVGPTGAGKTTIINLIPRFYDVTKGALKIDGIDVRDVTRESLREQIGIVLQDTFLFSDTVTNNIRYGRPAATDEEVVAAAQLARADTFIDRLPEGYETVLGERGSGLSQGQRQLIAIARVALMNPRILILDEATSSVDTRTEREIQTALDRLLAGRTSFVVAHRLSTIRNADQVLVLQAGRVIEQGTHDELLEQSGFYADLYNSQFRRVGDGE